MKSLETLLAPEAELTPLVAAIEESEQPGNSIKTLVDTMPKEHAVTQLAERVLYWEAKRDALKAFFAPYLEAYEREMDFIEKRRERAEVCVAMLVDHNDKFVNDRVAVSWRASEKGNVIDEELIPIEFTRVKTEPALDLLKAAVKQGQEIPGYSLIKNYSLQIKRGGLRAKANARKQIEAESPAAVVD